MAFDLASATKPQVWQMADNDRNEYFKGDEFVKPKNDRDIAPTVDASLKKTTGGFDLSTAQKPEAPAKPKEAAKPAAAPAPKGWGDSMLGNVVGGAVEPALAMGSGMVAKPVSDVMSTAAVGKEMVSPTNGGGDPAGFKRDVQSSMTYEPKTAGGKFMTENNPLSWLGKAINAIAGKAGGIVAPPKTSGPMQAAAGYGVEELVKQLPNLAGAKGGAKMAEGIPAKQAALDVAKGENVMKDSVRTTAQDTGYITPPESGVKAGAAGLAGKSKVEKILSEKNTENATRRLGAEVGAPEGTALNAEEFERLKEDAGKGYEAMTKAAGPKLEPTPAFRSAIQSTLKDVDEALARNPETNAPLKTSQRLLRSMDKQTDFPTEATLKDIQNQRKWAKADFQKGNNETATARLGIANKLEDLFEENLAKTGDQGLVAGFKQARERFAKIYLLERVTNDATGKVDLSKLASLSDSKAYKGVLTGSFKDAADFAKTYRKAAQKSTGEASPRLTVFDGMFAGGTVLSAIAGHPGALAVGAGELAGRLGVPMMAERGMLQNKTPSYQASQIPPNIARMLGIGAGEEAQLQPPPPGRP
jgi:hypothetical protein